MRFLMLGLNNAGKTTVLKRINGEDISQIAPTLGFNIKSLIHRGYTLNIWDIGGQKTLRPYWQNYFERTDVLLWVVDAVDERRMGDCRHELHDLLQEERLMGASLLVFANKSDVEGAMSVEDIQQALQLDLIKSHAWKIQSCSAKTGENLLQGFDWVTKEVSNRLYYGAAVGWSAVALSDTGPMEGLKEFQDSGLASS